MSNWTHSDKISAYYKATPIAGSTDRIDCDGRRIRWEDYGKATEFGWQIDHHPIPQAFGRCDEGWNLRARHHRGNASAGGLLGAFLREEPSGILGGAFAPSSRNAMLDLARQYAEPAPQNAMANALMGLPPLLPRR